MPKFMKLYKDKSKANSKRHRDRLKNYKKGRFGNKKREPFNRFEIDMILGHNLPDRVLAKKLGSSVNSLQSLRWRLKNNYLNLYGELENVKKF